MRCRKKHILLGNGSCRRPRRRCGISDMRPWTLGDNVNLAVGQGDLQATPLQMAVAYSTLANGGRVLRAAPRPRGRGRPGPPSSAPAPAGPPVKIDATDRQVDHRRACTLAASAPGGTSADVFAGWPQGRIPVYGKTGTAQNAGQGGPVLVRRLRLRWTPRPQADRGRRDRRAGRLRRGNGGADRPPDPRQVVRREGVLTPGRTRRFEHVPITDAQDRPGRREPAARPRALRAAVRPRARAGGHRPLRCARWPRSAPPRPTTSPGQPHYYVERQASTSRVGPLLAIGLSRSTTRGCASSSTASTAS